ncbi:proline dehydrogenase family protein [Ferruginibacter sp. SUN002]|uniref:proline dehydrogenase family protein n=1 Tax=Ferruginibacter sp. SUN002 TaxID=2937789 RepID=UPI003D3667A4
MTIFFMVSFDNTELAFAYKTTAELKKANFLFSSMGKPWLVNVGLKLIPTAIKWNLPFTKKIIRNTIFQQFVGGETLSETAVVADRLENYGVQVILDYGVEGGEDGEAGFDHSTEEFIRVIDYAATQSNIPFMSIKVTGFARFGLLEKLDSSMNANSGTLMKRYLQAVEKLSPEEKNEWHAVRSRMLKLCEVAANKKIGILVDAEETWIQDPVDALTILMMDTFNKGRSVIYNTVQLYRHDRLKFLHDMYEAATERDFTLGVKIVRGAYMEKERSRAAEMNYQSPIQPDKAACDKDYNAAVDFCIGNLHQISVIVASHNEHSNLFTIQLMQEKNIPLDHNHVHFSQLYGMSDNITFNLAAAGCRVSKYLPFGPIKDVIPYLMRRAQENTSVSGQTGRELLLIKKELKRRSIKN